MSAMLEQLDELIAQYEDYLEMKDSLGELGIDECVPEKPKFEVTDKSSAEWVLRKIAQMEAGIKENNQIAKEQIEPLEKEIDKIRDWADAENNKIERQIEFMKSLISFWASLGTALTWL